MLIVEFTINELPTMTNQERKQHWTDRHRERVKWGRLVRDQLENHGIKPLQLTKATLTLTRYSSKAPDPDGLVSGFKGTIDSMVKYGLLIDDNFDVIGMPTYKWEMRAKRAGGCVTVRVET